LLHIVTDGPTVFGICVIGQNLKLAQLLFAHGAIPSATVFDEKYSNLNVLMESQYFQFLLFFLEHDPETTNWFKQRRPPNSEIFATFFNAGSTSPTQRLKNLISERILYLKQIRKAIFNNFYKNIGIAKIVDEYTHGLRILSIFEDLEN
jgi:hypothetical protein